VGTYGGNGGGDELEVFVRVPLPLAPTTTGILTDTELARGGPPVLNNVVVDGNDAGDRLAANDDRGGVADESDGDDGVDPNKLGNGVGVGDNGGELNFAINNNLLIQTDIK
jgi:hypothetical protein